MARHEDIVNTFWDDVDHLSDDAVLLYLWSWTNQKCGMAGIYKIARRKLAEGRLDEARLEAALAELEGDGKLRYADGVLWNCARIKRLSMVSENIAKSIARDVGEIDTGNPLLPAFLERYGKHPKLEPHLTLVRPSGEGQENGSTKGKLRPSGEGRATLPGQGQGSGQGKGEDQEFQEWLEHYRATTGRSAVEGSAEARRFFNARRADGVSLADLKLATLGCHGDPFLRERKLNRPETILRASKFRRYIDLAKEHETPAPVIDLAAARTGLPALEKAWREALPRLEGSVPDSTFKLWLEPLVPTGILDGKAVLGAPDHIRSWVERRYSTLILEALGEGHSGVVFAAIPDAGSAAA